MTRSGQTTSVISGYGVKEEEEDVWLVGSEGHTTGGRPGVPSLTRILTEMDGSLRSTEI